jgi:hypothetical protein
VAKGNNSPYPRETYLSFKIIVLLQLGASNTIYSNQICRKKIVRGVRNRFDKQISSIIRREYRSQENLFLLRGKYSYGEP